jgi:hypothetical protein
MEALLLKKELRNTYKIVFEQTEIEKKVVRCRTTCENNTTMNAEETEHEIIHPV